MRCERCTFENIPGRRTCVQCGSVLELASEQIDIYPPRMPKWGRPVRFLLRLMRKGGNIIPQKGFKLYLPAWITQGFDDIVLGLFLSIIPGLAHITQRRFKEIRWYFLIWLILLATGLFLYGSQAGFICLGLAIGIHSVIAFQYKILKEMDGIIKKTIIFIIIFILLTVIYRYCLRILIPNLTGGYSSLTIPHQKIASGDFLLGWCNSKQSMSLKRGDLVFIYPETTGHYFLRRTSRSTEQTVVQIVGLAGEHLEIKDGTFIINGQQLDSSMYPVPQWLQINNFSVIIPDNSYFINVQYSVAARGNAALNEQYVSRVCVINANDIESKVFMLWWPLTKRGFIR